MELPRSCIGCAPEAEREDSSPPPPLSVFHSMHPVLLDPAYPVMFPGRTGLLYIDRILAGPAGILNTAKSGLHMDLLPIGDA
jgi:hypothetical protein